MTTTKPHTEQTSAIRPVLCAVCEQRLYYYGDARAEPEMVVTIQFRNADYSHRNDGGGTFYVHERCFDGFQVRFSESSVSPASTAPVVDESAWLLEKMHNGNVHYIAADYVLQWSDDPNKALRLARREDAEALTTIVEDCERIAEHGWPAAATAAPVEQSEIDNVVAVVGALGNQWGQERKRRIELYQDGDLYYDGLVRAAELIVERLRGIQTGIQPAAKLELPSPEYWNRLERD